MKVKARKYFWNLDANEAGNTSSINVNKPKSVSDEPADAIIEIKYVGRPITINYFQKMLY